MRSLFLFCFLWLTAFFPAQGGDLVFKTDSLAIATSSGVIEIAVEVADTPQTRARGLMFRRELPSGSGMLFDFEQPLIIQMWMKNTLIPLDMLFVASDGTIVHIAQNAQPHSKKIIASPQKALAVLEIGGGEAQRLGIAIGDRVSHSIFAANGKS